MAVVVRSAFTWVFACTLLAGVLVVIAFGTTGWTTNGSLTGSSHAERGLWKQCACSEVSTSADWFKSFQGLITVGVICILLAVIFVLVHTCCATNAAIVICIIVFNFVAVLMLIIGFIVLGLHFDDTVFNKFGWSWGIAVVATLCSLLAGILASTTIKCN